MSLVQDLYEIDTHVEKGYDCYVIGKCHEAADEIERQRTLLADRDGEINRLLKYNQGLSSNQTQMETEIERLRALLRHADDVVIWEHTSARSGFQEEIEMALGIGSAHEQKATPQSKAGTCDGSCNEDGGPGCQC